MEAFDTGLRSMLLLIAGPGGKHRSVAVGELISRKLGRRGVTTVHVEHLHHVRGLLDPQ